MSGALSEMELLANGLCNKLVDNKKLLQAVLLEYFWKFKNQN